MDVDLDEEFREESWHLVFDYEMFLRSDNHLCAIVYGYLGWLEFDLWVR